MLNLLEDLRAVNRRLEQTTRDLLRSNEDLKSFVTTVSHDLRAPLRAIQGFTEAAMEETGDVLGEEASVYLRRSLEAARRMDELIEDLLEYSRLGTMRVEVAPVDLDEVVDEVLAIHQAGIRKSEAVLDVARPLGRILGHDRVLVQVLSNLVSNALKFVKPGEKPVVHIRSETRGGVRRVWVEDRGIGIPAERVDRLFKSFSQVDASMTRKYGGTGLGLAICKGLVEMMGGEIGVHSEEGHGSVFHFTVPFRKTRKKPPPEESDFSKFEGKRILVAEPHPHGRESLTAQLKWLGCEPECVAGGEEALRKLEDYSKRGGGVAAVFVCRALENPDCWETAERIKKDHRWRRIPLVLMSSGFLGSSDTKFRESGFCAHLAKPVKHRQIKRCLESLPLSEGEIDMAPKEESLHAGKDGKRKYRILIAEDNRVNQLVALRLLEKRGFRADCVANGREAVEAFKTVPYDAILMDCQMPEMDGYEATAAIRALEAGKGHIPIIAMTASALEGDRERCLNAGMDAYVTKPVDTEELIGALEQNLFFP